MCVNWNSAFSCPFGTRNQDSILSGHGTVVRKGDIVKNQGDVQDATIPSNNRNSTFAYLVAGLGIGAAVSIFLAPRSGAETRQWIANKCLNGLNTANEKVRQTRLHVKDMLDQGQQKISEAIVAGRKASGKTVLSLS